MARDEMVLYGADGFNRRTKRWLRAQAAAAARTQDLDESLENEPLPFMPFQLPAGGLWSPRIKRPYHRATGLQIAAANPFSAADMYEPAGPVIGIEMLSDGAPFTFDMWEMYRRGLVTSPNLLIEGGLRGGKSFIIKRIVTLLVTFGRFAINTSDSKGEHGVVAEAIGGSVFKMGTYGNEVKLNCLEAPERRLGESVLEYEVRVKTSRVAVLQQLTTLLNPAGRAVTARESSILDWAVDECVKRSNGHPTVRGVWEAVSSPELLEAQGGYFKIEDTYDIRDGLRRLVHGDLGGMFDTESTVTLDPNSPYTVIDTFAIGQRGAGALAVTQAVTNAWVNNTISNKQSGRQYLVLREEGWRDMKTVEALEAHQEQLKLSGELGIALVLVVHEGGDFDSVGAEGSKERELAKSLLRGYANRICFHQPESALRQAVQAGTYTRPEADSIARLRRGQFLVKLRDRSYVVDGTRTSTDWERELFDTDAQMRARALEAATA